MPRSCNCSDPQTLEDQHAQRVYRGHVVEAVSADARQIFDDWVALREIEPDYARLANAAAVNRWELMRLAKRAERSAAAAVAEQCAPRRADDGDGGARACQLLANRLSLPQVGSDLRRPGVAASRRSRTWTT